MKMKKVAIMLFLTVGIMAAQASLLGEQVFAEIGIHNTSTNPFDAGFVSQALLDPGALQTVGAGTEWTWGGGSNTFDMDANTLEGDLSIGAVDLPFNGFRFTLQNPNLLITGVSILENNITSSGSFNVVVDPLGHGFGIDINGSVNGGYKLQIDTTVIPEPTSLASIGLVSTLGLFIRRRFLI